jgi:hypothetical protein
MDKVVCACAEQVGSRGIDCLCVVAEVELVKWERGDALASVESLIALQCVANN